MGCRNSNPKNASQQDNLIIEYEDDFLLKQDQIKQLYLFGSSESGQGQIIIFDAETEQFSARKPPENFEIADYSAALYINPGEIIISGGGNVDKVRLYGSCYLYDTKTNSVKVLPSLKQPRYGHNMLLVKKRVYAFGGRSHGDDDKAILNSVECLDLEPQGNSAQPRWRVCAPLLQPRVSSFSGVYGGRIIVFGGYVKKFKRSRRFEMYDEALDKWELLNIRLQRGIDNGLLISSPELHTFYILGGQIRGGDTKAVHKINLQDRTVQYIANMNSQRGLFKYIKYNSMLYFFGGDNTYNVEKFNIKNWEWGDVISNKNTFSSFIAAEAIDKFCFSQQTVEIRSDADNRIASLQKGEEQKNLDLRAPSQVQQQSLKAPSELPKNQAKKEAAK